MEHAKNNSRLPVVIVGGGIAGLVCFYELNKKNVPCLIYEENFFFGGRYFSAMVHPAQNFFKILRTHRSTIDLCLELNIPLRSCLKVNESPLSKKIQRITKITKFLGSRNNGIYSQQPEEQKSSSISLGSLIKTQGDFTENHDWAFDSNGPCSGITEVASAEATASWLRSRVYDGFLHIENGTTLVNKLIGPFSKNSFTSSKVTDIAVSAESGFRVSFSSGLCVQASQVIVAVPLPKIRFPSLREPLFESYLPKPVPVCKAFITMDAKFFLTTHQRRVEINLMNLEVFTNSFLKFFSHISNNCYCVGILDGQEAQNVKEMYAAGLLQDFVRKELLKTFSRSISEIDIYNCCLDFWDDAQYFWPTSAPFAAVQEFRSSLEIVPKVFVCGESVGSLDPSGGNQGWMEAAVDSARKVVDLVTRDKENVPLHRVSRPRVEVWDTETLKRNVSYHRLPILSASMDTTSFSEFPMYFVVFNKVFDLHKIIKSLPRNIIPFELFLIPQEFGRFLSSLSENKSADISWLDLTDCFIPAISKYPEIKEWITYHQIAFLQK